MPDPNKSSDIAVIDELVATPDEEITRYDINKLNPPPRLVMEIGNKEN